MQNKNPLAQTLLSLCPVRENIVVIHGDFVEFTGSLEAAALLNQCLYWTPKAPYKGGWFWKTDEEWASEIFSSKYAVRKAVTRLQEMNVLEFAVWKEGDRPVTHYRLKMDNLIESWNTFISVKLEEQARREEELPEFIPTLRNRKIGLCEIERSDFANPESPSSENEKTLYTETTHTDYTEDSTDQIDWLSEEVKPSKKLKEAIKRYKTEVENGTLEVYRAPLQDTGKKTEIHLQAESNISDESSRSRGTRRKRNATKSASERRDVTDIAEGVRLETRSERTGQTEPSTDSEAAQPTQRKKRKSKQATGESPSKMVIRVFTEAVTAHGKTPNLGYNWSERAKYLDDILATNTNESEIRAVIEYIIRKTRNLKSVRLSLLAEKIYEFRPAHSKRYPVDEYLHPPGMSSDSITNASSDDPSGRVLDITELEDLDDDILKGLSL